MDPDRGKFYINLDDAHRQLACATLQIMHTMLRFNLYKLETSTSDLKNRIEKYNPTALPLLGIPSGTFNV